MVGNSLCKQKDSARRISDVFPVQKIRRAESFFLSLTQYFLKTMYPSTTILNDDEDSFELMYPEQDAAAVCVSSMLLPEVDWFVTGCDFQCADTADLPTQLVKAPLDEDSMELMYPEHDAAEVCEISLLLPYVDWLRFSVCRGCCGPSNAVGKCTAGAAAPASSKGECSYIVSLVKTSI